MFYANLNAVHNECHAKASDCLSTKTVVQICTLHPNLGERVLCVMLKAQHHNHISDLSHVSSGMVRLLVDDVNYGKYYFDYFLCKKKYQLKLTQLSSPSRELQGKDHSHKVRE